MRVLVTGGTGYLGGAIVAAAVARGHSVVVLARDRLAAAACQSRSLTATSATSRPSRAPRADAMPSAIQRLSCRSGGGGRRISTTSMWAGCGMCWRRPPPLESRASSTRRPFWRCRRATPERPVAGTTISARSSPPTPWPARPRPRGTDRLPLSRRCVWPGPYHRRQSCRAPHRRSPGGGDCQGSSEPTRSGLSPGSTMSPRHTCLRSSAAPWALVTAWGETMRRRCECSRSSAR